MSTGRASQELSYDPATRSRYAREGCSCRHGGGAEASLGFMVAILGGSPSRPARRHPCSRRQPYAETCCRPMIRALPLILFKRIALLCQGLRCARIRGGA